MTTAYATSGDGVSWDWHGTALTPRPGTWDQRGARLTAVLPDGRAADDGRASKDENWFERSGTARLTGGRPGELEQVGDDAVRRSLPRRPAASRRRIPHLVRGAVARREPRAPDGAHRRLTQDRTTMG